MPSTIDAIERPLDAPGWAGCPYIGWPYACGCATEYGWGTEYGFAGGAACGAAGGAAW